MPKEYIKRLLKLGSELKERMEAEQEGGELDTVPQLLAAKINYICGFIEALDEKKRMK